MHLESQRHAFVLTLKEGFCSVLLLPAHGDADVPPEDSEMWVAKIKEVKARPPSHEDVRILWHCGLEMLLTDRDRFGSLFSGIGHRKRWAG